jgi:hypothetical protein
MIADLWMKRIVSGEKTWPSEIGCMSLIVTLNFPLVKVPPKTTVLPDIFPPVLILVRKRDVRFMQNEIRSFGVTRCVVQ